VKPNPGPGAVAYTIRVGDDSGEHTHTEKLTREVTQPTAEFAAVLAAFAALHRSGYAGPVQVYSNSQTAMNILSGGWRAKQPHLADARDTVWHYAQVFASVSYEWRSSKEMVPLVQAAWRALGVNPPARVRELFDTEGADV
jgi:ribonuclease HI